MKKVLGLLLITIGITALAGFGYGIINSLTVHSSGHTTMVQMFRDPDCTQMLTSIEWGDVYPDSIQNKTIYVKNFAGKQVTMTMTPNNWNPVNASQYMTITWNREGEPIDAGTVLESILSLNVYPNTTQSGIGDFTVDILFGEAWQT